MTAADDVFKKISEICSHIEELKALALTDPDKVEPVLTSVLEEIQTSRESSSSVRRVMCQKKRRLSENALKDNERSDLATTGEEIGIWHYDLISGEIQWNDRCKAIFGFHPDAGLSAETVLSRLHPDDRRRMRGTFLKALNGPGEYACE